MQDNNITEYMEFKDSRYLAYNVEIDGNLFISENMLNIFQNIVRFVRG